MKRILPFILGLGLSACVQAQDVRGTVFEIANPEAPRADWKRAPSAGAFAVVHWTGRRPGFGHYQSVCIQAAIARTDAQGRFAIAQPPALRSTFLVWRDDPAVALYKPGFDERSELRVAGPSREWSLVPTRLEAPLRAAVVEGMSDMGCRDESAMLVPLADPQGVLAAFRAALAAELPAKAQKFEVRALPPGGPRPAAPEAR